MSTFEYQRFTAMMKYPFDLCISISAASLVMVPCSPFPFTAKSTVKTVSNPSLTVFELTREYYLAFFHLRLKPHMDKCVIPNTPMSGEHDSSNPAPLARNILALR